MAKRHKFKEAPLHVGVKPASPKIDETTVPAIKKTVDKLAKVVAQPKKAKTQKSAVAPSVHSSRKSVQPRASGAPPQRTSNAAPTAEIADQLQRAFDHFNTELFKGNLAPSILKLDRLRKYGGYFKAKQWTEDRKAGPLDGTHHEIVLDPRFLRDKDDKYVLSILAHEMVHQLIFDVTLAETGKIKRPWHCRHWCEGMRIVGLEPVILAKDGKPSDKPTGANASHKIEKGGEFDKSADALLKTGFKLAWLHVPLPPKKEKGDDGEEKKQGVKVKYVCGECEAAAWGKPELKLTCTDCDEPMKAEKKAKGK